MANGTIDYDYDEVLSYVPKSAVPPVEDLANNLNTLGNDLSDMQEVLHGGSEFW